MEKLPSNWTDIKIFLDSLNILKSQVPTTLQTKKVALAFQHLSEHIVRLNMRRERVWSVENQMLSFHFEEAPQKTFAQLQLEFIDALESFFQGIYAALGALAKLVHLIAPPDYTKGLKVRSMQNFLAGILERHGHLESEISKLETARAFRALYIDHTQQHKLHNWMTYSLYPCDEAEHYVIYYYGDGDQKKRGQWSEHPYDKHFVPPISCDYFSVSPLYRDTFNSFKKVVLSVLSDLVAKS